MSFIGATGYNENQEQLDSLKDEIDGLALYQITITGYSATDKIDNQTSAIINLDYAGLHFIYRNGWRII
jgi:hypothetical protein